MRTKMYRLIFLLGLIVFMASCTKDDPQELKPKESTVVERANELLSGTIVLSTKAKMSSVDKTLLPQGCPAKYNFAWDEDKNKLEIALVKFQVGNMPFAVAFKAYATYTELNSWEKQDYPENGWIKFSADNGEVFPYVPEGTEIPPFNGAGIVKGYVNPNTQEVEFIINYNMMNVMSHCFRQKIDRSRLKTFDQDLKQYEKDLEEYKKKHGL